MIVQREHTEWEPPMQFRATQITPKRLAVLCADKTVQAVNRIAAPHKPVRAAIQKPSETLGVDWWTPFRDLLEIRAASPVA